jgi:hypothetical protein
VTGYATRGAFTPLPYAVLRGVAAEMKKGNLVLLRGSYVDGGQPAQSWMLGTLFTTDDNGAVKTVVANDPVTGAQVEIDVATKRVVLPRRFPLRNFKIDAYIPVTIN